MSMRSKFVGKDDSIHGYIVEWDASTLAWADFRGKVLGPTDPADAPAGAIRKLILERLVSKQFIQFFYLVSKINILNVILFLNISSRTVTKSLV